MLDLGWSEILLIVVVAVAVMKPEDIPKAMQAFGRVMRRVHYIKFALSQQFEDIMKDADLDELRKVNFKKARDLPDTDEAAADTELHPLSVSSPPPSAGGGPGLAQEDQPSSSNSPSRKREGGGYFEGDAHDE